MSSKKEYYSNLDSLINNYLVNGRGLSEIKSLLIKLIRLNFISSYKLNQSVKLCGLKKDNFKL